MLSEQVHSFRNRLCDFIYGRCIYLKGIVKGKAPRKAEKECMGLKLNYLRKLKKGRKVTL